MANLVRIPQRFFDDHEGRDLPTPTVVRATKRHYYIRRDDPAYDELLDDAEYYAGDAAPDWAEGRAIRASAKATVAAMKAAK